MVTRIIHEIETQVAIMGLVQWATAVQKKGELPTQESVNKGRNNPSSQTEPNHEDFK